MSPCDWCEVRFLAMSFIALVGLWHIYLVRVPRDWQQWPDETRKRIRQYMKRKNKR